MNAPSVTKSVEHQDDFQSSAPKGALRRQKSASTEQINQGEYKNFRPILKQLDEAKTTSPNQLDPPPPIQPYSGVLSKSLFSVVLKPQAFKPSVSKAIKSPIPVNLFKSSESASVESNVGMFNVAKKCVSTTNLNSSFMSYKTNINSDTQQNHMNSCLNVNSASDRSSSETASNQNEMRHSGAKTVSFVPNANNTDSSENSLDMEENEDFDNANGHIEVIDDCNKQAHPYDNRTLSGEINVEKDEDHDAQEKSEKDKRMLQMEGELKMKNHEIFLLRKKLQYEMDKQNEITNSKDRNLDELEEERQIYEQKLNSIRAHFNQQLKLFEQNEKLIMQEKMDNLQKLYNDLKINYKKHLDNELKNLRLKLADSQDSTTKLYKQLQTKANSSTAFNCVTTQTDSSNETMENKTVNELFLYVKKLKYENNELKFQMEADRRQFQIEKEKWFRERLKFAQVSNVRTTNEQPFPLQMQSRQNQQNKHIAHTINLSSKQNYI
jgi:hypothetical protein